ncbi:MAG: transcriptional regulator, IclR family [Deltaproteobacteria bacterium]|nr:transcriptional regulator, IclR family [Deltaproteobacteria bacterium]
MYSAPVIKKTFEVLSLVVDSKRPLGVTEIARTLALSKSTVFGILKALQEGNLIVKSKSTKRYAVGEELFKIAKRVLQGGEFSAIARPLIEKLVEEVNETVFLCVREDSLVKVIDTIETRKKLKISSPVGTRFPITASVFCKAFVAPMQDFEIRDFLKDKGLPKYTENSITDIERFIEDVKVTRNRGYSLDLEEYLIGVRAIATLVYANDYPVAAICILGFAGSMPTEKLPDMAERLMNTARRISERLSQ